MKHSKTKLTGIAVALGSALALTSCAGMWADIYTSPGPAYWDDGPAYGPIWGAPSTPPPPPVTAGGGIYGPPAPAWPSGSGYYPGYYPGNYPGGGPGYAPGNGNKPGPGQGPAVGSGNNGNHGNNGGNNNGGTKPGTSRPVDTGRPGNMGQPLPGSQPSVQPSLQPSAQPEQGKTSPIRSRQQSGSSSTNSRR